ncbi:MAG: GC-type dockerin domain-anchored protein [Phycisphaerales bacterium]
MRRVTAVLWIGAGCFLAATAQGGDEVVPKGPLQEVSDEIEMDVSAVGQIGGEPFEWGQSRAWNGRFQPNKDGSVDQAFHEEFSLQTARARVVTRGVKTSEVFADHHGVRGRIELQPEFSLFQSVEQPEPAYIVAYLDDDVGIDIEGEPGEVYLIEFNAHIEATGPDPHVSLVLRASDFSLNLRADEDGQSADASDVRLLRQGGDGGYELEISIALYGVLEGEGEQSADSRAVIDYEVRARRQPGCGIADRASPYGVLDYQDVVAYFELFTAGDPIADLAEPYGEFDLRDIRAFQRAYVTGCGDTPPAIRPYLSL